MQQVILADLGIYWGEVSEMETKLHAQLTLPWTLLKF